MNFICCNCKLVISEQQRTEYWTQCPECGHTSWQTTEAAVTYHKGTIVWYSIAEGHLPPKTNDSTNGNLILYSEPLDQFTRGFYRHDIDMWGHNTGNWQPTHFAYINYPEPENSVKEQSS